MSDAGPDQLNSAQARLLTSALTATSEQLFQLIQESAPEILKAILHNPNICADHLISLLKRRDLSEHIPKLIHQRQSNNLSHKLTLALVKNPSTPGNLVRSLLPLLRLFELVDLCVIPGVTHDQRLAAERELIKRLPTTPLGNKNASSVLNYERSTDPNIESISLKKRTFFKSLKLFHSFDHISSKQWCLRK